MTIDLKALIAKQQEMWDAIEPVDVEIVLGDRVLTARVPFIKPDRFTELTGKHPAGVGDQGGAPHLWFSLDGVTRNYPDIVIIDGDETDDLYVMRDKQAVYTWPELYPVLSDSDRATLRSVVWGMHVYEPERRKAEALKAKASKEVENG